MTESGRAGDQWNGEWDTRDYWMDLYNKELRANRHRELFTSVSGVVMFVAGLLIGRFV